MPLTFTQRIVASATAMIVAIALFEATSFLLERVWDDAPVAEGFAVGAALGGGVLTARSMSRSFKDREVRRLVAQRAEPLDEEADEDGDAAAI